MVFVISIYDDFSTSDVLTWIRSKGETIIRINNYEDIAYMFKCLGEELTNAQSDLMKSVTGVWFRRCPHFVPYPLNNRLDENATANLLYYYKSEHKSLYDYLNSLLSTKRWLNNDETSAPSKIRQLDMAKSFDIMTPEYKTMVR